MDSVQSDQVLKAVRSLIKFEKSQSKPLNIIDDPADIFLCIGLKKIPEKAKLTPTRVAVKHSLYGEQPSVCLFTKDPQKEFKALLQSKSITCVTKVIGVSKLRAKYKPFEARRLLCRSYNIFLADDRILPLLPKLLGKEFFTKKKLPFAVNMRKLALNEELSSAIRSTSLTIPTGSSLSVKIGHCDQADSLIVENILDALPAIVSHIPKKWSNIQTMHLKTTSSIALPIFCQLPEGITHELIASISETHKRPQEEAPCEKEPAAKKPRLDASASFAPAPASAPVSVSLPASPNKAPAPPRAKKSVKINATPMAGRTPSSNSALQAVPSKSALKHAAAK